MLEKNVRKKMLEKNLRKIWKLEKFYNPNKILKK